MDIPPTKADGKQPTAPPNWWGFTHERSISMTIFGVDVSEFQDGMSLAQAKSEGIAFAIIRLCDGTYRDRVFASHLADAEAAGLAVSTYFYLRAPSEGSTIAQQVDVIDSQMGSRRDLGVWIDVESISRSGAKLLTGADVWEAKRELERRGYHVPGVYSGPWYWEQMIGGEPSMDGLGALWMSSYGTNPRTPYRDAYPGDDSGRWAYPLGNRKPDILQYGSEGLVCGRAVDVNAYRGSLDELRAIFYRDSGAAAPAGQEVPTMSTEQMIREIWEQLRGPGGRGWPQLGQDAQGRDLTPVDALAAIRIQLADLAREQQEIKALLKGAK